MLYSISFSVLLESFFLVITTRHLLFLTLVFLFFNCYLIEGTPLPSRFRPLNHFIYYFLYFQTISFANMSSQKINRSLMLLFVYVFGMPEFKRMFNSLYPPVKDFLMFIEKADVFAAKDIIRKMKEYVSRQSSELKESPFLTSEDPALGELSTEEIYMVLIASLTIYAYVLKDGYI